MSDKDKQKDDDIISTAEDAPEMITDEQMEDVDGGAWTLKNVSVSSYSFGGTSALNQSNMDTIYAGGSMDTIYAGDSMDGILDPGVFKPRK